MKKIIIYGSTGSIGKQTLDIVRDNREEFEVVALAANKNVKLLLEQAAEFNPKYIVVYDEKSAESILDRKVYKGMKGLIEVLEIAKYDYFVNAIVGMIGIMPTLIALKHCKKIGIANKETLVTAGHLIMPMADKENASIIPIDSEHSAILQCMGKEHKSLKKILLTASGGPFRDLEIEKLKDVTIESALNHPNWSMGKKISIDSATMANKALEVMEASCLFNVPIKDINVVIHKESIIHSMVEFIDNSIIAQMAVADMRLPISYALFYPDRRMNMVKELDLFEVGSLSFTKPDYDRYEALRLGIAAGEIGGSMQTVFNIANELAVAKFLDKKIGFTDIPILIEKAMNYHKNIASPDIEEIFDTVKEVETLLGGDK